MPVTDVQSGWPSWRWRARRSPDSPPGLARGSQLGRARRRRDVRLARRGRGRPPRDRAASRRGPGGGARRANIFQSAGRRRAGCVVGFARSGRNPWRSRRAPRVGRSAAGPAGRGLRPGRKVAGRGRATPRRVLGLPRRWPREGSLGALERSGSRGDPRAHGGGSGPAGAGQGVPQPCRGPARRLPDAAAVSRSVFLQRLQEPSRGLQGRIFRPFPIASGRSARIMSDKASLSDIASPRQAGRITPQIR